MQYLKQYIMKKKGLNLKRLAIRKETIAMLHTDAQAHIAGGGGTQASGCHSCISQCLCPQPPSGNVPCCPAPASFLCATQDEQAPQ